MKISVVEIRSQITPVDEAGTKNFFKGIEEAGNLELSFVSPDEYEEADFGLIFIATGGTEGIFLRNLQSFASKPCYLLTSGESNSLAASMEILSYLKATGHKGEILHGSPEMIAGRVNTLYAIEGAKARMRGMKVGWLGGSSDWLINSAPDRAVYKETLGIELVDIQIDELIEETKKGGYVPNEWTEKLLSLGYDRKEMEKSLNVYGAMKRIVEKYELSGLTVRCFDLLNTVYTTGCLALAILNAEGIYAGCEGDMPSLISMLVLGELTGKPVFMCNLNKIDTDEDKLLFAHCTLPLNMPYEMSLTTHYESGIGVAIAGSIPEEDFTIFKLAGDLSACYADEGKIIQNLRKPTLCRTQIEVHLHGYEYFLKDPICNHHCVCTGKYKELLEEFYMNL